MDDVRISKSLSGIHEDNISENSKQKRANRNRRIIIWIIVAACICLIVTGSLLANHFFFLDSVSNKNNNIKSFFTITALAANGESTKLSPASSVFNSSNPGKTIFGNDYPTFSFSVLPSESDRYEEIYMQFEVSVSYGGKTVNGMDEHIAIAYLINPQVSDKTSGYSICGWFTEPTDLVITLTDKESKKVVEEITLNVKYDSDRQEYELKLLGIDNEYSK